MEDMNSDGCVKMAQYMKDCTPSKITYQTGSSNNYAILYTEQVVDSDGNCIIAMEVSDVVGEANADVGDSLACEIPAENIGSGLMDSPWCSGTLYEKIYVSS